ncbi:MAG: transposase family protein [Angustibacter sp.]
MSDPTTCCRLDGSYCDRCDVLLGLDGVRVVAAERDDGGGLVVMVESKPAPVGCLRSGVVPHGHGPVVVFVVDAPSGGQPVVLRWRKRRFVCPDLHCPTGSFTEQDERVARPAGAAHRLGVPVGDRAAAP